MPTVRESDFSRSNNRFERRKAGLPEDPFKYNDVQDIDLTPIFQRIIVKNSLTDSAEIDAFAQMSKVPSPKPLFNLPVIYAVETANPPPEATKLDVTFNLLTKYIPDEHAGLLKVRTSGGWKESI